MTTAERSPAAVRQARHRRHRKGDHSMCLETSCEAARPAEDAEQSVEPAKSEFGTAGQAIWDGTLVYGELTETQRTLLRQVCRMADRMDELHEQIRDNADDLGTVKWLMRESRQTAIAMKNIVGELRMSGAAGGRAPEQPGADNEGGDTGGPSGKGPGIGDLTARIAARIAQAAG
jgi:phosphate uptake regulator